MTNKTVESDNAVEFNVQPYLGFDFTPFNHYILYCGFDKHWFKQNAQSEHDIQYTVYEQTDVTV